MTTLPSLPPPAPRPRSRLRLGHWAFVLFAAMTVVAAVEAAGLFRLSRQAEEIRDVIGLVANGDASTQVQFSVGPGALGLARFVVGFIDDVPPEALHAMQAVDHASVGVYRLRENPTPSERFEILSQTSDSLAKDGWYRVVAVQDDESLVMIFAPDAVSDPDNLQFCVVVCDKSDLVVVSAHGNAEPLREIAAMRSEEWRRSWRSGHRDVL